jgi:endonuclease/exonuclease/phosphatase family metal-dependent hydrolase
MTSRIADQNRKRESVNFRIATYNMHRYRGLDRRVLPKRIAEVLRPLQADVIALQEVLGAVPKGTAMIRNVALPLEWDGSWGPRGRVWPLLAISGQPVS